MKAIETLGLTKRYGANTAVRALDLQIEEGELYALLGINGAGKTTTIKMLAGLSAITEGRALIFHKDVATEGRAIKPWLNLSPQETAVARNLTVLENLRFIAGIYGLSLAESASRTEEMVNLLGLQDVLKMKAKALSGGMARRLSIAMALITRPRILFLDEPTLGLDVIARRELWAAIRDLKGVMTVILTTHYMEEAESLADRVGIMAKGSLVAVGTPIELIKRAGAANFEDAFIHLATEGGMNP